MKNATKRPQKTPLGFNLSQYRLRTVGITTQAATVLKTHHSWKSPKWGMKITPIATRNPAIIKTTIAVRDPDNLLASNINFWSFSLSDKFSFFSNFNIKFCSSLEYFITSIAYKLATAFNPESIVELNAHKSMIMNNTDPQRGSSFAMINTPIMDASIPAGKKADMLGAAPINPSKPKAIGTSPKESAPKINAFLR